MKKQDLIKVIEIHMKLGDFKNKCFEAFFNDCEIGVTLAVLDTVIVLKSSIEKSIGGNKNG